MVGFYTFCMRSKWKQENKTEQKNENFIVGSCRRNELFIDSLGAGRKEYGIFRDDEEKGVNE